MMETVWIMLQLNNVSVTMVIFRYINLEILHILSLLHYLN